MPNIRRPRQLVLMVSAAIAILCTAAACAKDKPKIQGSISLQGKSKNDYSAMAKISLQDAIAIAAKEHPGKVIEVSLDKEDGFLVYEIEILTPSHTRKEILIDAGTGKTLLVKDETNEDDEEENE